MLDVMKRAANCSTRALLCTQQALRTVQPTGPSAASRNVLDEAGSPL